MDTEKLNQWLGLLANFGVLIGIVFLAFELQQNTAVTRSAAELENANAGHEYFLRLAESPELSRIQLVALRGDYNSLSEVEQAQWQNMTASVFLLMEGSYKQYQLGFITEESWSPYEELIMTFLDNPISRDWWINSTTVFSPGFEEIVTTVSGLERAKNQD